MMKKVFVQRGVENAGKSSAIRLLFDLLLTKHPEAEVSDLKPGKPPFLNKSDVRAIIRISDLCIAIESQGDPWCKAGRLEKSLRVFVQLECDIIICAARTSGGTVEEVEGLRDHGFQIIWRQRSRAATPAAQDRANRDEASWMFRQIDEALTAVPA